MGYKQMNDFYKAISDEVLDSAYIVEKYKEQVDRETNPTQYSTENRSADGFVRNASDELEKSAEEVDDKFRTGKRIVSLPGQVDFKQITLSSTDMQFLESRKFTVREICRFFGVHPTFVFDDTSNNYKSAEMANVAFLSHTLDPILRNIENELQRKLLPESSYTKRKISFDRKGLYASDLDSRVKYQAAT
mgnify:CR=1 FL=1